MDKRPSWHEYFFKIAEEISKRSTCTHAHMGCVFVSDDHTILSTGYNGSPRGMPHCIDEGCDVDEKNFCTRTIHAEINGIVQAAKDGISLKNCVAYINAFPCYNCFKAMANLPVRTIYYGYKYKPEKYGAQYEKVEKYAAIANIQLVAKRDVVVENVMAIGKLILFEGPEKCGKSTQVERAAGYLIGEGYQILTTKEPGGGFPDWRQKIFALDPKDPELAKKELALFEEDRAEHFSKIIILARNEGKIVLCDRNYPSTKAYQGYGRGMDLKIIDEANRKATEGAEADLIILFDVSPEETLRRIKKDDETKVTRFEKEPKGFHEKVRQGFLAQAKEDPEHWIVLDGTKSKEELARLVQKAVREKLGL